MTKIIYTSTNEDDFFPRELQAFPNQIDIFSLNAWDYYKEHSSSQSMNIEKSEIDLKKS